MDKRLMQIFYEGGRIMRILTELGAAWRNYLYANRDGKFNDAEDFLIRVELITDSHSQILETMLENEPNMDLVKECKDEIAYQRNQLEDMVKEFVEFANLPADYTQSSDEILTDLCDAGSASYLYEIASDWKEWGVKVNRISERLNDSYGYGIGYVHDELCKLIMEEVYAKNE